MASILDSSFNVAGINWAKLKEKKHDINDFCAEGSMLRDLSKRSQPAL